MYKVINIWIKINKVTYNAHTQFTSKSKFIAKYTILQFYYNH